MTLTCHQGQAAAFSETCRSTVCFRAVANFCNRPIAAGQLLQMSRRKQDESNTKYGRYKVMAFAEKVGTARNLHKFTGRHKKVHAASHGAANEGSGKIEICQDQ